MKNLSYEIWAICYKPPHLTDTIHRQRTCAIYFFIFHAITPNIKVLSTNISKITPTITCTGNRHLCNTVTLNKSRFISYCMC